MTVIIRLQNLPWTANALDIRRFFQGLSIPDGGVHIVGGDKGDAFIAFNTDDDARQAMYRDNNRVLDSPVKLFLSSKSEMQNVIAVARGAAQVTSSSQPRPNMMPNTSGPMTAAGQPGHGIKPGMMGNIQQPMNDFNSDSRDVRTADMAGFPNQTGGPFDNRGPPEMMESFDGRLGGSEPHGGMDRMVPQERRMGGPDRMGGGSDRMGGPDRMGGGPDRMGGGPDRMGGGPDRMGGGPDRMGGGPDRMRGGPDRMGGFQERVGGHERMGGLDRINDMPDRMGSHDRMGRLIDEGGMGNFDRMGGGLDRMGGGLDRMVEPEMVGRVGISGGGGPGSDIAMINPDRMLGLDDRRFNRDLDRMGGRPDRHINMGVHRPDDVEQYGHGRVENFGRPGHSGEKRFGERGHFHDRDVDNGRGNGFVGDRDSRIGDQQENWARGPRDDHFPGGRDLDRRPERVQGFHDESHPAMIEDFARIDVDQDSRMGFHQNMSVVDDYHHDQIPRNTPRAHGDQMALMEFQNTGPRGIDQQMSGDFGRRHLDIDSKYNEMRRSHEDLGFVNNPGFQRNLGRGRSPEQNFNMGRGGFAPRGSFHGHDSRKRGHDTSSYVFVQNMPPTISYKEVRRFFGGLEIPRDGLKLINDKTGQRIGEAFVMFARSNGASEATNRSGLLMGHKKVIVKRANAHDFENAIDSYVPGRGPSRPHDEQFPVKRMRSRSPSRPTHDSIYIIMKNVHFKATKDDVKKFLGNLRIKHGGPHIDTNLDGRPSGNAYVEFETRKDQQDALKLHKEFLLGRPVEIYSISRGEFDSKVKRPDRDQGDKRLVEMRSDRKDGEKDGKAEAKPEEEKKFYCIRMRGLPFSATVPVIEEFFAGLKIANRGVHLVMTRQGQAAGVAFVEFVTSADCKKALEKDKQYMGKRYIEISTLTKKDMLEELSKEQQKNKPSSCILTMSNLPFEVQLEDIMEFFRGFRALQDTVRLRYSKDGQPMGDAMVAFTNPYEAERAVKELDQKFMMGRQIYLKFAENSWKG